MQLDYIYATDFFTIDTVLNIRCYVFFIISHKTRSAAYRAAKRSFATRKIVQFALTRFPVREFIKQQIIEFENKLEHVVYLIHDKSGKLCLNYAWYNIIDVPTSTQAPNMNASAERFIGSVRSAAYPSSSDAYPSSCKAATRGTEAHDQGESVWIGSLS